MDRFIDSRFDLTTKQGIFNHVAAALIKQGKPSYRDTDQVQRNDPFDGATGCLYRGPDNCKCAAGHLIPDDSYNPSWEGCAIGTHSEIDTEFMAMFDPRVRFDPAFLNDLQIAHDNVALGGGPFHHEFRANMATVAEEHGLNTDIFNIAETVQ